MRTLLIGTVTALALVAGSAMAQSGGAGGGGGEQNTTVPRAGKSTMTPGTAGSSGDWSAGNPGGTTAGSGATGGYTAKGTAKNRGDLSSTGDIDARSDATAPGKGKTYDSLKQGSSGASGNGRAVSGSSTAKPQAKSDRTPQAAQRATGTHCPPGTPDCRPGNMNGQ